MYLWREKDICFYWSLYLLSDGDSLLSLLSIVIDLIMSCNYNYRVNIIYSLFIWM